MKKRWRQMLFVLLATMQLTGEVQANPQSGNVIHDLPSALQAATTRHPSVKSKLSELQSLGFKLEEAEASRLPSIVLAAQTMSGNSNHGLMRVQQTLWSFGKIEGSIGVAERRIDVGKSELLQVRRQLLEETAAVYVTHWGAKQRLIIAEGNVAEHDQLYQMILRRHQGGLASEADARLALSRLIQAQAQRDQLRGTVDKARNDLISLTQTSISADKPVDPVLTQVPPVSALLAAAQDNEARVQVRLGELEVVRKEAALRKVESRPTLYARYERDITKDSSSSSEDRIGIVLEGTMEGMGVIARKRVDAETARVAAAQENVEDTRTEVRRRIITLMTERETQNQIGASFEYASVEMENTLNSFLRQYDVGRKSWVDVLNSQRELSDMRQQREQARTLWLEMSLRLAAINGQLDSLAEVKP